MHTLDVIRNPYALAKGDRDDDLKDVPRQSPPRSRDGKKASSGSTSAAGATKSATTDDDASVITTTTFSSTVGLLKKKLTRSDGKTKGSDNKGKGK